MLNMHIRSLSANLTLVRIIGILRSCFCIQITICGNFCLRGKTNPKTLIQHYTYNIKTKNLYKDKHLQFLHLLNNLRHHFSQ